MPLKDMFEDWGKFTAGRFSDQQWLLAKWEVCEGVVWPPEKIELMLKIISDRLSLGLSDTFVDLGCGGGWMLKKLAPDVGYAAGVDFSREMIANAAAISAGDVLVQGEIGRLPFHDAVIDRALCYFVLINMMDDAFVERSILDMMRVLKPGGKVLIGQLPDKSRSAEYDKAKAGYLDFCQQEYDLGHDFRDINRMPQKLFDVGRLCSFLVDKEISYQKLPAFNPFFRQGEPETVDWRFDLLLEKE